MANNKTQFTKEELEGILEDIFDQESLEDVHDIIGEIASEYNLKIYKSKDNEHNEEPLIEDISNLDTDLDLDNLLESDEDF